MSDFYDDDWIDRQMEMNPVLGIDQIDTEVDPFDLSEEEAQRIAAEEIARREQAKAQKKQEKQETNYEEIRRHYRLEQPITMRELLATEYHDDYLIYGCLVANQPALTGGASKTLKTTLEVARCLSLISGKPFLGHFTVSRPCSVFLATAESGKATVQKTFIAIAKMMEIDLTTIPDDMLKIAWWVPRVSNLEMLDYFAFEAAKSRCDVIIIDPLYKVLDDQQSSMVLNGQQLTMLANRIFGPGCYADPRRPR